MTIRPGKSQNRQHLSILLIAFLLTVAISTAAHARKVADVEIAESIQVAGQQLTLNGAGIRRKLFFKIYIGALYTKVPLKSADLVLDDPDPKRIHMYFLYDEVSSKKLKNGWQEGFENNHTEQQMQDLQPKLDQFNEWFDDMRKGDTIDIDFDPASGVRLTINNQTRGHITGRNFMRALLRVWLGEAPADTDLKDAMLGRSE